MGCEKRVIKRTRPGNPTIIDETFVPFIPGDFETRTINDTISEPDFWTLLAIVVRENYNSEEQGFADVAQAIYNRFGVSTQEGQFFSGYSPGSTDNKTRPAPNLKALILSPRQFEPAFTSQEDRNPSPSWVAIQDYESAVTAVTFDKNKGDFSRYTRSDAGELLLRAFNVLSDPNKQDVARKLIQGRTDFKSPNSYKITNDPNYGCGSVAKCGIPTEGFSEDKKKEIRDGVRGHFVERQGNLPNNAFGWAWDYIKNVVYDPPIIPWDLYKKGFPQLNS